MADYLLKYVWPNSTTGDVNKKSIYKIPTWLKDGVSDTTAYTPEIISFGPYHRGTSGLEEMEIHKSRCLTKMLNREGLYLKTSEIAGAMRSILTEVWLCYGNDNVKNDDVEMISDDEFLEMLVLDGCFMLEYLRVLYLGLPALEYELNDPVFSKKTTMEVIGRDMIKLENQLPIIVLQTLLDIQYEGRHPVGLDLPRMVLRALSPIWISNEVLPEVGNISREEEVAQFINDKMLHCLDIFRSNLLYRRPAPAPVTVTAPAPVPTWTERMDEYARRLCLRRTPRVYELNRTNSVEDLRTTGIKLKIRNEKAFWDVRFDKHGGNRGCLLGCLHRGLLEIPPIQINKTTKTMFLNLIAYEQCHLKVYQLMEITDYVVFMDALVNTGADVALLHKAGIIVHQLGNDNEVADLFNGLVKKAYVAPGTGRLQDTYIELNNYCAVKRHIWCADLRNNYLRSPWVCCSVIAAFALFTLTFLQTFFSIFPYYNPRSR